MVIRVIINIGTPYIKASFNDISHLRQALEVFGEGFFNEIWVDLQTIKYAKWNVEHLEIFSKLLKKDGSLNYAAEYSGQIVKGPSSQNKYSQLQSALKYLELEKENVRGNVLYKEGKAHLIQDELEKYKLGTSQYEWYDNLLQQNAKEIKEEEKKAEVKRIQLDGEINKAEIDLKIARKQATMDCAALMIKPLKECRAEQQNKYLISASTQLCGDVESRQLLTSWVINQNVPILGKVFGKVEVTKDYTFPFKYVGYASGGRNPMPITGQTLIKAIK